MSFSTLWIACFSLLLRAKICQPHFQLVLIPFLIGNCFPSKALNPSFAMKYIGIYVPHIVDSGLPNHPNSRELRGETGPSRSEAEVETAMNQRTIVHRLIIVDKLWRHSSPFPLSSVIRELTTFCPSGKWRFFSSARNEMAFAVDNHEIRLFTRRVLFRKKYIDSLGSSRFSLSKLVRAF